MDEWLVNIIPNNPVSKNNTFTEIVAYAPKGKLIRTFERQENALFYIAYDNYYRYIKGLVPRERYLLVNECYYDSAGQRLSTDCEIRLGRNVQIYTILDNDLCQVTDSLSSISYFVPYKYLSTTMPEKITKKELYVRCNLAGLNFYKTPGCAVDKFEIQAAYIGGKRVQHLKNGCNLAFYSDNKSCLTESIKDYKYTAVGEIGDYYAVRVTDVKQRGNIYFARKSEFSITEKHTVEVFCGKEGKVVTGSEVATFGTEYSNAYQLALQFYEGLPDRIARLLEDWQLKILLLDEMTYNSLYKTELAYNQFASFYVAKNLVLKPQRVEWSFHHEIGHAFADACGKIDTTDEFGTIMNTEIATFYACGELNSGTEYDATNKGEYFANAFKAYLEVPTKLNQYCPKTYFFISNAVSSYTS